MAASVGRDAGCQTELTGVFQLLADLVQHEESVVVAEGGREGECPHEAPGSEQVRGPLSLTLPMLHPHSSSTPAPHIPCSLEG